MTKIPSINCEHLKPHLGKSGLAHFETLASKAHCYLEYGSGGSTLRAHNVGAKQIISVDSSKAWTQALKTQLNGSKSIQLIHADIGETGKWGKPSNGERMHDFHNYMIAPWQYAFDQGIASEVDLIMIDGRFRVASFLYSLLCAESGTHILFDDYAFRPRYHIVEAFCAKHKSYGRMAEFIVKKDYDLPKLVATISRYSVVKD